MLVDNLEQPGKSGTLSCFSNRIYLSSPCLRPAGRFGKIKFRFLETGNISKEEHDINKSHS
jgi:hypothetical protein